MSRFDALKVKQLKNYRKAILEAVTTKDLCKQVKELESYLTWMQLASKKCEVQEIVRITIGKIQKFWMHDTTRFEVCRWVQTIICELNQN